MDLACPKCGKVYSELQRCPHDGAQLTRDWSGKAAVVDPEKSRIAKQMDTSLKGIYALKI
jgi:DNA-directed RNA polymerase subunit E"